MRELMIRLLAIQALVGLAIAAGFFVGFSGGAAVAALYGTAVALVVSLLLALRIGRLSRPGAGMTGLLLGALERMVFVIAAFAFGMVLLRLAPLAVVAGFGGAELAYFLAAGPLRRYVLETIGKRI